MTDRELFLVHLDDALESAKRLGWAEESRLDSHGVATNRRDRDENRRLAIELFDRIAAAGAADRALLDQETTLRSRQDMPLTVTWRSVIAMAYESGEPGTRRLPLLRCPHCRKSPLWPQDDDLLRWKCDHCGREWNFAEITGQAPQDADFVLNGGRYYVRGRGTVYTATLTKDTTREALGALVGRKLETPDGLFVIAGVESFCIERQSAGVGIGLLVKPIE